MLHTILNCGAAWAGCTLAWAVHARFVAKRGARP